MFACGHCNRKFKYDSERKRHEQSHSPQFQCKICNKKFSFLSAVRRHEKQHNRKEKVKCCLCEGTFRDETLYKRHMKYAHKGNFSCPKCNAAFSSEAALKTHSKVHKTESERKFRCSFLECGKSFNFSHHLKHHELTHSNSKQHHCNLCGKGFIQLHHLKTHIKTHNPDKWLPCSEQDCKKKFATEYALKRHEATHKKKLNRKKLPDYKDVTVSSALQEDLVSDEMSDHTNHSSEYRKPTYLFKVYDHQDNNANVNDNDYVLKISNPISQSKLSLPLNRVNENNYFVPLEKSIKNTNDIIITDCKTALGGCLVSGSNEINENCLCAQMYNTNNNYNKTLLEKEKSNELPISTSILKDENKKPNNKNNNNCNDCECLNKIKQDRVTIKCGKRREINNLPELEHRIDGVVKIKETFDVDIKIKFTREEKIVNNNLKRLPFNSCKAALGNCIASEDCLCAKMMIDEEQMNAQEIAELTPLDFSY